MRILIAPNAFKHSLSAAAAAKAIAAGIRASAFRGRVTECPIADGGDGTAELLRERLGGRRLAAPARDPLGRRIESHFDLLDDGRRALIEFAAASGLWLLRTEELDPLHASSEGTGDLVRCALDHGVAEIILCAGGSATVDGGTGILRALGVDFLDAAGRSLIGLPESLTALSSIDMTGLDPRLAQCALTVLCDVANPLLGEYGAATVFGPQKGATPATVQVLESALGRFSQVVFEQTGRAVASIAGGGAAGGVAAGLGGLLDARLVGGTDYFLTTIDFDRALDGIDVVITGEGSLDEQTAAGKGPWGVALRAKARGAFVVGLAGQVPLAPSPLLRSGFDLLLPIGHRAMPLAEALGSTAENLTRSGYELGNMLAWADGARRTLGACRT